MSQLVPVKIPPGFFRNGTEYEASGRWYDGNLVRWKNGRLRPWGGWARGNGSVAPFGGIARAIMTWRANNGFRYIAVGTNTKLYLSGGGNYSDITPVGLVAGRQDAVAGPGYGASSYGSSHYGTRRLTTGIALDAATWSMDLWGEDLLCVLTSDGKLYEVPPATGVAAVVANAPVSNTAVLVTDEAYVVLLGAGGNLRSVKWCSQGDDTVWTASATNTAGGFSLSTQGNIVTGRKIGSIPLVFTTTDVHSLNYLGPPLVYGTTRLAENCGVVSANAIATDTNTAYWMGINGFFIYDGVVRPLPCDVQDYVFNNLNTLQRSKVFVGRNSQDGELIWFYPSVNSLEVNSYVVYNYFEKIWYFGTLARTAWADRGTFVNPVTVGADGYVYEHEVGELANGASRNGSVFIQSGPAEIGNGDRIVYSTLMLPDVDPAAADAIQATFKMKTAPMGRETDFGPYGFVPTVEGYVPIRVAGRQASIRIDQIADKDWSLGTVRFLEAGGGKR